MPPNNPFDSPPSSFFVSDSLKDSIDMESFSLGKPEKPSPTEQSIAIPFEDDKLPMTVRVRGLREYQGVILGTPVMYSLGSKENVFVFMAHISEATTLSAKDQIYVKYDTLEMDYAKVISVKVENIKNNIGQITLVLEAN